MHQFQNAPKKMENIIVGKDLMDQNVLVATDIADRPMDAIVVVA